MTREGGRVGIAVIAVIGRAKTYTEARETRRIAKVGKAVNRA
jgi:hypothetical protein